jgi:hypothetical protein
LLAREKERIAPLQPSSTADCAEMDSVRKRVSLLKSGFDVASMTYSSLRYSTAAVINDRNDAAAESADIVQRLENI